MFLKMLMLLAIFFYSVHAGCKNENITSNYRTLYITANSGGLVFANTYVDNPSKYTPYASFAIASLSEKDSNGNSIANRTYCFNCNQTNWIPDSGFSACVNAASAYSGSGRVIFSVTVDNWEWSNTTVNEQNITQKPNFLDVTLVVKNYMETITASKQSPSAVDYGYVAVGKYRMKFSQTYISDSVENQMMPSDFPLLSRDGVASSITLRFVRQSNLDSYVYQPEMLIDSTSAPKGNQNSSGGSVSDNTTAPIAISVAAVVIILAAIAFWQTKQREEKYMAVASLTVPSEPRGSNYASLDDNEVSGQEYEQIMLEQGGKEIDIPEGGDDCLAADTQVDEAYAQEDPEFSSDARPNSLLLH